MYSKTFIVLVPYKTIKAALIDRQIDNWFIASQTKAGNAEDNGGAD